MLTERQILNIVKDITYKDWRIVVEDLDYDNFFSALYLQVRFEADGEMQLGRKWLLSHDMTKTEIVLTALKAILTAEEHEAREAFRYKGKRVFGPHLDIDKLVDLVGKKDNLDLRDAGVPA